MERLRSYLDERSCARSRSTLDASVDGTWTDDPMLAGLFGAANMIHIPEQHSRRLLTNPDDWYERRQEVYEKYASKGPNVIEEAMRFVEKNRKDGNHTHPINMKKDPKSDLDDTQRLV